MRFEFMQREDFDYSDVEYEELYGSKIESRAEVVYTPMTRSERRRRTRKHKAHLKRLSQYGSYFSGACEIEDAKGNVIRIQKKYRGRRSTYLKTSCNRQFRRNNRLKVVSGRSAGLYRKATEILV